MNLQLEIKTKPIFFTIILLIIFLPVLAFSLSKGFELYLLGIVTIFPLVVIFLRYPKVWIYFSTLLFTVFLIYKGKEDEAAFLEILIAILIIPGIFYFLFYKMIIERKLVIENYGDLFIIFFVVFLPFNAIIAVLNDVDFIRWLREVTILLFILMYFPIREYIKKESDLIILLACAMVAAISSIIYIVYNYKETILGTAAYAYELMGLTVKEKINHIIFTSAYFTSIVLFVTRKNFWLRVLLFAVSAASLIALIITVSRTFWIVAVLGTIILFIYYGWKERMRFIFFYGVVSIATIGVIYFAFGSNYQIVTRLIEQRFLSATKGKKDKSLQSRLAEYPVVLKGIAEYPLGGNGFAKSIRFREPIRVQTIKQQFIHNGFTSLPFRAGIPLSLFYISFFIFYFVRSFRLILLTKKHYLQPYVLSAFMILVILLVSQTTFQQYLLRDFNFAGFIAITMIEFVNRNYKRTEFLEK
ncbi:MAG: O-antigen ligase family protein [Candidatus Kapaibacteriota bacterium]|jgi:hypothetical protein